MTTRKKHDAGHERAALYALGVLPDEEAHAFEEGLAAGDAEARDELSTFRSVVDNLAYAAPPQAPPPALRARVLAHIAAAEPAVLEQNGLRFVRGDQLGWEAGAIPGVQFKRLHIDSARGRRTSLVRMAPGVVYPRHRHADVEEIYLLEGDLQLSGVRMRAGDYCNAAADTVHEGVVTSSGCLFIVTACERDQFLG